MIHLCGLLILWFKKKIFNIRYKQFSLAQFLRNGNKQKNKYQHKALSKAISHSFILWRTFPAKITCFYLISLQNLFIKHSTIHVTRNPLFFKKKKVNSNLKKMCISVYGVELFQKMYDVMKLCDKLEILKRQIKVIFMCKY